MQCREFAVQLLDMCRTTTNVTGDCMVATLVAHAEGDLMTEAEVQTRTENRNRAQLDENP